ncbi:MAG: hypothetical protein M9918_25240 [Anaerolineae bacterium]|nr:hypothetical protein [Anaerolineae bacterium]MCO5191483.1 hypothetical protein [Anaerolineae bacterium]
MRLLDGAIAAALLVAAGALAVGFFFYSGNQAIVFSVVLPIAIWGIGRFFKFYWTTLIAFTLFVLLALIGVMININTTSAIVAVIAALALLDLDAFRAKLLQFDRIDEESRLIGRHFGRLGMICALSLLLYGATFLININLGVWSALLLAIILFYGLSRAVTYLRRESD